MSTTAQPSTLTHSPAMIAALPTTANVLTFAQHKITATASGVRTFHISADYCTTSHIGGISAVLLLALSQEFSGMYKPTILEVQGTTAPRFVKLPKGELAEQIGYCQECGHLTNSQATTLRERFGIKN